MNTCEYAGEPVREARSHPWTESAGSPDCRYYDLTAHPSLIRTSLENFVPWQHYGAVRDFYTLLETLNRSTSVLESNDCAFEGPQPDESEAAPKALQCSGRLMVLFRALETNVEEGAVHALKDRLHRLLANLDRTFREGVIGTTLVPVRYLALPEHGDAQQGLQLMISFWAWGDSEPETMRNLRRVFKNLAFALLALNRQRAR